VYEKFGPLIDSSGGVDERRFYVAEAGAKGHGVFADELIYKGDIIGVYTGVRTVEKIEELGYDYDYEWSYYSRPVVNGKELTIGLDGKYSGNMLRFLNDGKIVNCENITIAWNNRWHAVVIAMENIQIGDELQLSYGSGYWEDRKGCFVA
jgi:SET domain-containing protein